MHKRLILLSGLLALSLLAGCGSQTAPSSKPDSAAPSSSQSSSSQPMSTSQSMSEPQNTIQGGTLTEALGRTVGYGQGAAGTTLNNVTAAAGLMDWFNSPSRDPLADPRAELEQWYDSLDEDSRQRFTENWPAIREQARSILDDPEGSRALLESAGVQREYSTMADGWESFVDSVNGFLEEIAQNTRRMMRR